MSYRGLRSRINNFYQKSKRREFSLKDRERVKGQWVFILGTTLSSLDPKDTGTECTLCSFKKAVRAPEMFTESDAYIQAMFNS